MGKNCIQYIQEQLVLHADLQNAQWMSSYMKTTMPLYGIKAPLRRHIVKEALKQYPINKKKEYKQVIDRLWNLSYREEKYIAIDIARAYIQYYDLEMLTFFEAMIRQGAWWDFVDDIAIHLVGPIVLLNQSNAWTLIDQWITDPNMWIRRAAIICQNTFKSKTDEQRLFDFCLQCAHEKEFFIRKAIGWALRVYAKTEPEKVYVFIEKNKNCFSRLSYTESIKGIQ